MGSNPLNPADTPEEQLMRSKRPLPVAVSVHEATEVGAQGIGDAPVSQPSTATSLDEAAKQQFLWHTHQYLGEYARFGDTKAAFAGAAASALLGALYSAKLHVPLIQTPYQHWPFSAWLAAGASVFLFATVALVMWTVRPRLRSTQSKGFIYWGSIAAHGNVDLLQTSFHSQSARTLNDHLLHHCFDISSRVLIPKYRTVSLCLLLLCIGGALGAAALLSQDFAYKLVPASSELETTIE